MSKVDTFITQYGNIAISEVFGNGNHVYDYLVLCLNGGVMRVSVRANNMTECNNYFKQRYGIKSVAKSTVTSNVHGQFVEYFSAKDCNSQKVFQKAICRKVA